MPRFDLELESQDYGGTTTITVADAEWAQNTKGVFGLYREGGGSGAEEVEIRALTFSPQAISVTRNRGDGTHFIMRFGIDTSLSQVLVTIDNSQAGNPASGFIEVRCPDTGAKVRTVVAGPSSHYLRVDLRSEKSRPRTMSSEQRYSLMADLVYPAALGAGIAWWFEGFIGLMAHENPTQLALWTLTFGLFFIVYHARNFLVLRQEYGKRTNSNEEGHSRYYWPTFTRDFVDCFALVAAFMCLRFPGGKMLLADPFGAYLMALLIPLSALITDAQRDRRDSWPLRSFALLPPLAGCFYAFFLGGDRFEPGLIDVIILAALIILLSIYLKDPGLYGVRKLDEIPPSDFAEPGRSIRVGAVVILSLLFLLWVAERVRFEPSERKLEKWVFVSRISNFVIGRPCRTDPELEYQANRLDSLLLEWNPARIKLVGGGDTIRIAKLTREFVGNNAGLAHYRAECVQRWLVRNEHFAGVEFQTDGDAPSRLDDADPVDRAVVVWVVPKDEAMVKKRDGRASK